MTPRVSILISVWNEAPLLPAVRACLDTQTLTDFEVVAVDDGSTDGSGDQLETFARQDSRWRVSRQANTGLTLALNNGLALCRAPLVARLDADDWAEPNRLQRQAEFLAAQPDIGLVGSWARYTGEAGEPLGCWHGPTETRDIHWTLCFDNPFAHSSAMFRRALVTRLGGYDPASRRTQDLALWVACACESRVGCLPEELVRIQKRARGISAAHADQQRLYHLRANRRMLAHYLGAPPDEAATAAVIAGRAATAREAWHATRLLRRLYPAFRRRFPAPIAGADAVRDDLARRLWNLARPHASHPALWPALILAMRLDRHFQTAFAAALKRRAGHPATPQVAA